VPIAATSPKELHPMIDPDQLRCVAGDLGDGRVALPAEDLESLLTELLQLRQDLAAAQRVALGLADRVAAQSELLTRRAGRC
jgi:hypothetical protein